MQDESPSYLTVEEESKVLMEPLNGRWVIWWLSFYSSWKMNELTKYKLFRSKTGHIAIFLRMLRIQKLARNVVIFHGFFSILHSHKGTDIYGILERTEACHPEKGKQLPRLSSVHEWPTKLEEWTAPYGEVQSEVNWSNKTLRNYTGWYCLAVVPPLRTKGKESSLSAWAAASNQL